MAKRYELNDEQWARIAEMLPGKKSDPGRTAKDNRLFVDGVLWVLRSVGRVAGAVRQAPKRAQALRALGQAGRMGAGVCRAHRRSEERVCDARCHPRQGSPAGCHRQGRGQKGGADEALGRSRGGLTTKIHLLADALGRPLRFLLTGGEVHESRTAEAMLDSVEGDAVIADKAYDSDAIRDTVRAAGMKAVIPSNRSRNRRIRHDKALYRERNRIERCFNKLKHFRRLATRYDRRARHFLAFLCLAGAVLWMR